jgi:hypothetical protein
MGQVLHSATTTEAVRRAIQHSEESLRALARRYGVNPKTVAKWKKRTAVTDLPTGPREPRSTVLTVTDKLSDIAWSSVRCYTARMEKGADDLQFRPHPHTLRLHGGSVDQVDLRRVPRAGRRLPRLRSPGCCILPVREHSGPILHRLSG